MPFDFQRFKCAHAAPASGHVPAFNLFVYQNHKMQMLSLRTDTKEREFLLEILDVGERESTRVRPLYAAQCRELRPGVFNDLTFECKLNPPKLSSDAPSGSSVCSLSLSITCNGIGVAQDVVIEDAWFGHNNREEGHLRPMLGLGVCKSKLEWEALSVHPEVSAAVAVVYGEGSISHLLLTFSSDSFSTKCNAGGWEWIDEDQQVCWL